jgi:hypothetical protein
MHTTSRSLFQLIVVLLSFVLPAACGSAAAATKPVCALTSVSTDRSFKRAKLVNGLNRQIASRAANGEAAMRAELLDRSDWIAAFDSTTQDQLRAAYLADSVTACTDDVVKRYREQTGR